MTSVLGPDLLTVTQLSKRWAKEPQTIWRIAKRYKAILQPVKIGRSLLFDPENVKKFEESKRMVSP